MKIHIMEYLEEVAFKYPDKTAIIDENKQLSFKELRCQAISLSHRLTRYTLKSSSPIAVFLPKSAHSLISYFAILYMGNTYVPLDTKSPKERMVSIIDTLQPGLIITSISLKSKLKGINFPEEKIFELEEEVIADDISEGNFECPLPSACIDADPAYIIFTSGSTGTPKGVVIPHRGVIDYIEWLVKQFDIDDSYIIGNQAPFFFDNSVFDIYLMLATGATLVLLPEELFIFPAKLLEFINESKINLIFWVPSLLVNIANLQLLEKIKLPYLSNVFFAGEVMPNKQLNYWRKFHPDVRYVNLYGPTEITVDCTYYEVERKMLDDESLPIGKACRNSGVILLNKEDKEADINEHGELCVRGSSLALGYYKNPEKTKEVFVQNPLNSDYPEIIYRTGDIVYKNERDEIIFVGRKDFQVKHMGYRIELGEIENAIVGLEFIDQACVLYNDTKKEISLFFTSGCEVKLNEIRISLVTKIPKYMIPTFIKQLDFLPLNANGKIDRAKLNSDNL